MSLLDEASLIVTPNGYKAQVLYSVKPTNGSGDMAVSRGSSATRVDSAGLIEIARTNLILQSQTFNNVYWTPTAVTVTADTTPAPDGTTTADTVLANAVSSAHTVASDIISFTAATSYSLSVFVKKALTNGNDFVQLFVGAAIGGMYANFNINTGVVGTVGVFNVLATNPTSSITNFGNGWYRCTMNFTAYLTDTTVVKFAIVSAANAAREQSNTLGTSVILWGAQLETSNITVATEYIPTTTLIRTKFAGITQDGGFGANIPRLDYTGGGCPSILVESTRTNEVFYSEEFDNAYWTRNNIIITANTTATLAPDGTFTADKFIPDAANSVHSISRGGFPSNAYTFSVFAKAGEETTFSMWLRNANVAARAEFNLSTGQVILKTATSATIDPYPNGWYRCSVYDSTPGTTAHIYARGGGGFQPITVGDGIFLWGAQVEAGTSPTSYIPTVAATLTRTFDVISKTGVSSLIGQTEGTIFVEANLRVNADERRIITVSNGTEAQRLFIWTQVTTLYAQFNNISVSLGNFPIGTAKIAIGYTILGGSTTYSIKLNNNTLITGTAATATNPLTNINLGSSATGGLQLNDRIKLVTLFTTRLTNTQLGNLTAI